MTTPAKPARRPAIPHASLLRPLRQAPRLVPAKLDNAFLGRSHRAKEGKARLKLAIDKTKALLGLPPAIGSPSCPASDTGAFEMAMWTMLGPRGVDVLAWESFGKGWVTDIDDAAEDQRTCASSQGRVRRAARSRVKVDFNRDVVFTWNGTTSGVRVPNGNWIPADRQGLTFVDATSAHVRPGHRLVEGRRDSPTPGRRCWAAKPRTAC